MLVDDPCDLVTTVVIPMEQMVHGIPPDVVVDPLRQDVSLPLTIVNLPLYALTLLSVVVPR